MSPKSSQRSRDVPPEVYENRSDSPIDSDETGVLCELGVLGRYDVVRGGDEGEKVKGSWQERGILGELSSFGQSFV